MIKIKRCKIVCLVLTICLLSSCGKPSLNKSEAKELIIKSLGLPQSDTFNLKEQFFNDEGGFEALAKAGLITYDVTFFNQFTNIKPTDKGKPFYLGTSREGPYVHQFKIFDIDFGEITNISINKQQQTATVSFTTKAINVTPVATVLSQTQFLLSNHNYIAQPLNSPINNTIVFKKTDTGWQ